MILYPKKAKKRAKLNLKTKTKNSQANDLQKKPDFYNFSLKKPIWQPCPAARLHRGHVNVFITKMKKIRLRLDLHK